MMEINVVSRNPVKVMSRWIACMCSLLLLTTTYLQADSEAVLTLQSSADPTVVGEPLQLELAVGNSDDLFGLDVTIAFSIDDFEVESIAAAAPFAGASPVFVDHQAVEGGIRVIATRIGQQEGLNGDGVLLTLHLLPKAAGEFIFQIAEQSTISNSSGEVTVFTDSRLQGHSVTVGQTNDTIEPPGQVESPSIPPLSPPAPPTQPSTPSPPSVTEPPVIGKNEETVQEPAIVRMDADTLSQMLSGEVEPMPTAIFKLPTDQPSVELQLPLSALKALEKGGKTELQLHKQDFVYELPITMLQSALSAHPAAELSVRVHQVSAETIALAAPSGEVMQPKMIGPLYDTELVIRDQNGEKTWQPETQQYITRMLPVPSQQSEITGATMNGYRYDPELKQLVFVPTTFVERNGEVWAELKRPGNSIYTLAEWDMRFADIEGHWAEAEIRDLASRKLIFGMGNNQYMPESPLTRAQFSAMLVRAFAFTDTQAAPLFPDVAADAWYSRDVGILAQTGIVTGYEDGSFRPDQLMSRAEMAVMADKALTFYEGISSFAMNVTASEQLQIKEAPNIPEWAWVSIHQLIELDVLNSMEPFTTGHAEPATRAEAAVVLRNTLQLIGFIP